MKATFVAAAVLLLAIGNSETQASIMTSTGQMASGHTLIDFSQFGNFQVGSGPVQVGGLVGQDVTWESTFSGSVIGNGDYVLGENGQWTAGRNGYVGLNTAFPGESMKFLFNDGPVAQVGGFVNYSINTDSPPPFFIEALDDNGDVIEAFNINVDYPILTPGQTDAGAFRGISRNANEIYGFRLTGQFDVLDDLRFSSIGQVPEPGSMMIFGTLFLGLAAGRRKRKMA